MTKSSRSIMTASQVMAVNEDKAIIRGGFLVNRTGECSVGKWWVLYEDGTEEFVSTFQGFQGS